MAATTVDLAHGSVHGLARTMERMGAALSKLWAESYWGALISGSIERLGGDKSLVSPHACIGHGGKDSTGRARLR